MDIKHEYKGMKVPCTTDYTYPNAGWVAPDGTLLICNDLVYETTHYGVAKDIMSHFYGVEYDFTGWATWTRVQHDLLLKGWARLDYKYTYLPKKATVQQIEVADKFRDIWVDMKVRVYRGHFLNEA